MRESDVFDVVRAAVEGLTRDNVLGQADAFRFLDEPHDPDTAAPRAFRVQLAKPPSKDDLSTSDDYSVEYVLTVYYPWSRGAGALGAYSIDRMIAADAERIDVRFQRLHEDNASINHSVSSPFGVEDLQTLIAVRYSVIVHYRLTSTVL